MDNKKPDTIAHVIVGHHDEVAAALERARQDGRLHAVADAEPLPDNRVRLTAHFHQRRARTLAVKALPWLKILGKALAIVAALAALAGLVWLIVLAVLGLIGLVTSLIAWITHHLLLIGAVVVGLVLLGGAAGGGGCGGIHCGGCRR